MYTRLMWDPDAINPSYIHHLVVNITNKRTLNGTTVLPYTPPAPPPGTGRHHYFTVLFKQSNPINISFLKRTNFDVATFVKTYDLVPIRESMFSIDSV
jgi:phosphatidylethanolamine-binding protein (PEBP) family uncharacterized protein